MKNLYSNKYYKISKYSFILTFIIAVCTFFLHHDCFALDENHLAEGIKLYRNGDYDEALSEFRSEVGSNRRCPLAYYYAAKIRIAKKQFPRARQNLEAAIMDSSGFHDASGLLAYTLLKMGIQTEAVNMWKEFVLAVGTIEGKTPLTANSIIFPEEYHKKLRLEKERKERVRLEEERKERVRLEEERKERVRLEEERKERVRLEEERKERVRLEEERKERVRLEEERKERVRLEEEKQRIDNLKNADKALALSDENAETEPITISEQPTAGDNADDSMPEADTPIGDLEKRIRSTIRTGIYIIIITAIFIVLCVLFIIFQIRKRKAKKEELTFAGEVERFLINEENELDEEKAIEEFEAKKVEILQELQPPDKLTAPVVQPVIKEPSIEEITQPPEDLTIPVNTIKSPITEEVKALVSRLYREGHTAEDIARTADLTQSEVNLILVVREHHTNSLIEELNREEEDMLDRDQLIHVIHDLSTEGVNNRDIAKRLNISIRTSICYLAISGERTRP